MNSDEKIKQILESKMPEEQKKSYMKDLGLLKDAEPEGVPFSVYAKLKKIPKSLHKAMQAYPKAKDVSLATIQKWDEIFKDF